MTDRMETEAEQVWRECSEAETHAFDSFMAATDRLGLLNAANEWAVALLARRMAWLHLQSLLNRPPPAPVEAM